MNCNSNVIHKSIMRDMSEGVMVLGTDGVINYINPAAAKILERLPDELLGKRFVQCFFEYEENDGFNQAILDAVYDSDKLHRNVVQYYTGREMHQLQITTSCLWDEGDKLGIIAVLSDISELSGLRDAVKAMEQIRSLNDQLEMRNKLLNETFGRFLSDEIVRRLLETPDGLALGGKKRCVTVMMSDLRGFTAMSEQMEPQSLITMLNHYLGEMTEIIQKRNGTIIEFIGDGIMAIFGAPEDNPDHAADGVAAAVEMQTRMEEINRWNKERGYPKLEMGIGINAGDVIVGNIGSERRTKYGIVGSNVNLCGRIESYTVGGQILVSPYAAAMIEQPLEVASEQRVMPKGVNEPLTLSNVTGIGGKYGLSCKQEYEIPQSLSVPQKVAFYMVREKHGETEAHFGTLKALGKTGAILETDAEIDQFDNLRLEAGGKLFCKVLEKRPEGWLLRFTSLPLGFDAWYKECRM